MMMVVKGKAMLLFGAVSVLLFTIANASQGTIIGLHFHCFGLKNDFAWAQKFAWTLIFHFYSGKNAMVIRCGRC